MLAQTACGLALNDMELGNGGDSKGVPLEVPMGS